MTINADCNNNKLEVSVSRNGLELSTASPTSSQLEADAEAQVEAQFEANSRPASTSPTLPVEKTPVEDQKAPPNRASPKKRVIPSSPTKTPPKVTKSAAGGDREFIPARTKRSFTMPVATSQNVPETPKIAPSRPSLIPNSILTPPKNSLPPLDNCDSIFAIVSLPTGGRQGDHINGVSSRASAKVPSLREAASQKRSSPTPPPPLTPPSPVDWKSQLNYELTMYQQMLANQAHRSPMVKTSRPLSSKKPSNTNQQPSSHQNHLQNGVHPRQQTPNSKLISNRQNQSQNHHQIFKQESRSSAHSRKTPSPVKSPVNSNDSTELTLDDEYPSCWTSSTTPAKTFGDKQKAVASLKTPTVNFRSPSGSHGREGVSIAATPYEQLLYAMENDKGWAKEVAFGRRIGLYRFKGDIGNGNFSQVKVAIHSLTKEKVAVKILEKGRLDAKTQRMLAREIRTMETLHHPNLIRIFEVIETLSKHYIVMELAPGGELFQVISLQGRLSESEGRFYFSQILSAIEHMHQHNLIHRDIKAENVFFSDPYTVKVGDFGFSTRITSQDELLSTFCGSPPYAAPELFRDESYRGPFVDYWALGVLLYFIVTGAMPFRAQTIVALKKLILDGRYDVPAYVSVECCQLIAGFLQPVPAKRYSLEAARGTRWLRGRTPTASLNTSGGVAKYDLKTSFGRLIRSRRLAAAERRNTLSEFTSMEFESFSSNGAGRTNRFSLVEPSTNGSFSPTEGEPRKPLSPPPNSLTPATPSTRILSPEERQTFRALLSLGIDDTVIVQHLERGSISAIVGTFRILMHRAITESAAAKALENIQKDAEKKASLSSAVQNGGGNLGRSTSIQVAAFDRFWANYGRKSATGGHTMTPNAYYKKQGPKQMIIPPQSSVRPGPRHATVRQTIRSPPSSKTEQPSTVVTVLESNGFVEGKRLPPVSGEVVENGAQRRLEINNGVSGGSSAKSKFSKMMAAMVIASSKQNHQSPNNTSQKIGVSKSATNRISANGSVKNGGVTMNIIENGFHAHENGHLKKGKPAKDQQEVLSIAVENKAEVVGSVEEDKEKVKVGRQKSTSSSTKSRSNEVPPESPTEQKLPQPSSNGHLPAVDYHSVNSSSGRLSRSWRTIKSLLTEGSICGTNTPVIANALNGPKSLPANGQLANSTRPNSTSSRASTSTTSSLSPNGTVSNHHKSQQIPPINHHVLHKTTTLQIGQKLPNLSTASSKLGSPLRRSQTTPNVSTCYRTGLNASSASSNGKKYNAAANGRCTIF